MFPDPDRRNRYNTLDIFNVVNCIHKIVTSDSGTAEIIYFNIVNWREKILIHLSWHRQLKPLILVINMSRLYLQERIVIFQ